MSIVHVIREMKDLARLRQQYLLPVLQHQHDLIDLTLYQLRANRARRRRGERRRRNWVRPWIGRRRHFGMYDQLMVELMVWWNQHPLRQRVSVMGRVWVMMDPPCIRVHGHGQETSLQHSSKFSSA